LDTILDQIRADSHSARDRLKSSQASTAGLKEHLAAVSEKIHKVVGVSRDSKEIKTPSNKTIGGTDRKSSSTLGPRGFESQQACETERGSTSNGFDSLRKRLFISQAAGGNQNCNVP